jgi:hypothetical protein
MSVLPSSSAASLWLCGLSRSDWQPCWYPVVGPAALSKDFAILGFSVLRHAPGFGLPSSSATMMTTAATCGAVSVFWSTSRCNPCAWYALASSDLCQWWLYTFLDFRSLTLRLATVSWVKTDMHGHFQLQPAKIYTAFGFRFCLTVQN